jgi:hypothetical protein
MAATSMNGTLRVRRAEGAMRPGAALAAPFSGWRRRAAAAATRPGARRPPPTLLPLSRSCHNTYTRAHAAPQRYILALRIKELSEVLDRLGLRKGGRKAELQTRVMSVFSPEGAGRCGGPGGGGLPRSLSLGVAAAAARPASKRRRRRD